MIKRLGQFYYYLGIFTLLILLVLLSMIYLQPEMKPIMQLFIKNEILSSPINMIGVGIILLSGIYTLVSMFNQLKK